MKRVFAILVCSLFLNVGSAQAQQTTGQKVADVASYGTWAAAIVVDVAGGPHTPTAFVTAGARYGATALAVAVVKHYFPSNRPCAPQCGVDAPDSNIPSGHTAFAVAAIDWNGQRGARSLSIQLALAGGTAAGRWLGFKHDWKGLVAGTVVGLVTGQIR